MNSDIITLGLVLDFLTNNWYAVLDLLSFLPVIIITGLYVYYTKGLRDEQRYSNALLTDIGGLELKINLAGKSLIKTKKSVIEDIRFGEKDKVKECNKITYNASLHYVVLDFDDLGIIYINTSDIRIMFSPQKK